MIRSWFDCVQRALGEFGEGLGLEVTACPIDDVPADSSGAVIPLTGERNTFLVGLMATEEHRRRLACSLLDMDVATGTPTAEEMDDAIGEMVNLAAGWIKNHNRSLDSTIELGVPMWLNGPPNTRKASDHAVRGIRLGDADLAAMLLELPLAVETVRRRQEEEQRHWVEQELRLAQKLEAVGQLAAGIAHEINTPTQYVSDNLEFLKESFSELTDVLKVYAALHAAAESGTVSQGEIAAVTEAVTEAEVDYLLEEIPRALAQSLEGLKSVAKIVQGMKVFSHPGSPNKSAANLNEAIEATVTVSRNEWKYVADLDTDLDPRLPMVPCMVGEFNQVLLNMVVNAAHAIADLQSQEKGKIEIATRRDGEEWVVIEISDTGAGIPEEIRGKVFDPFFTTKDVGKGTGQGLAIAHSVVVEKHGGSIAVESEVGKGTTFTIRLPLGDHSAPAEAIE